MSLRCVKTIDEIYKLWPRVEELWWRIREQEVALPVDQPVDTLKKLLNFQEYLFVWEVEGQVESMVLGEFVQYGDRLKVFRLNGLAGKIGDHWAECLKTIEDGAIREGAQGFEFWGRPGLGKFLGPLGYRLGMQHYIKRVDDGQQIA